MGDWTLAWAYNSMKMPKTHVKFISETRLHTQANQQHNMLHAKQENDECKI